MKTAAALLLACLLGSTPLWADLGGSVSSVESDRKAMRGQVREASLAGYSVHEITAPDGSVVREFVSVGGVVFGVAWSAPVLPNLQQLLGTYFPKFQQAAQSRAQRRGPLTVRSDRLVVESAGHMRAFHGRAYDPSLVPINVSPAVVR